MHALCRPNLWMLRVYLHDLWTLHTPSWSADTTQVAHPSGAQVGPKLVAQWGQYGLPWWASYGVLPHVCKWASWFTGGDNVGLPMWSNKTPVSLKWVDQMGFVCGIHVSPTWFTSGGHVSPTWNLPITHLKQTRFLLTTHKKLIISTVLFYCMLYIYNPSVPHLNPLVPSQKPISCPHETH